MIDIEDVMRKRLALYRAYDIRAERKQRSGRGKKGKLTCGPYLLFSREKGAGGSAVAELAGKRLGWQVFNSELVDAIAEKANVRRELIESLDERDRKTIQDAAAQGDCRQGFKRFLPASRAVSTNILHFHARVLVVAALDC